MSGWVASTPLSMMAMRTPLPMVVFQGPVAGPPGTLLPYPPTCRTAHPCGEVV